MTAAKAYRFEDWIVEPHLNRVSRGGQIVEVEPSTMDTLSFMLEHPGETLSIDQFLAEVWQGRIVEPNSVHRNITMIRRALGDDARNPRYIGNVRKRGYRTLAPVAALDESLEDGDQVAEAAGQPSTGAGTIDPRSGPEDAGSATVRPRTLAAVAVLILVAFAWWMVAFEPRSPADREASPAVSRKSVAVLPFTDMSPEGDQQYFGNGIAEELLDELTRLKDLRVISRATSFAYWRSGEDIRAIAKALDVATVLHGSVRKSGDRLRITAQLIDARDGLQLWSKTYDRDVTDIFAIQDEIAAQVSGVLGVTLGVGDANAFRGAGTDSFEAYEMYLRAMQIPGWPNRSEILQRAVDLDPEYGAALAALGISIAATQWQHPPEAAPEIRARAEPILERAVAVESGSAYTNAIMANAILGGMDWKRSERHFRAAELIQSNGELLGYHANMLMRTGRSSAALSQYAAAGTARRDAFQHVGSLPLNAYLALERYDGIQRLAAEGRLRVDPRMVDYLVAMNRGDLRALKAAAGSTAEGASPVRPPLAALLQTATSAEETLDSLRALLNEAAQDWPSKYHDIALLAAFFGDPRFALDVLSTEARLVTVRYGALWYPIMSAARQLSGFRELVTDVGLVDYWREYGWSDHCRPLEEDDFECF